MRYLGGNRVQLLQGGDEFFPALVQAISQAREEVWLETYIYHDDASGRRVTAALAAAARRGVTVRVVIDGFGSRVFSADLRTQLLEAGVQLSVFRPERGFDLRLRWLSLSRLRRLHRKLALVDGRIAFVGGINILDDHIDPASGAMKDPRFDFAVAVQGALVGSIAKAMLQLWLRLNWKQYASSQPATAELPRRLLGIMRKQWQVRKKQGGKTDGPDRHQPVAAARSARAKVFAAFVVRDNVGNRQRIENAYLSAIRNARQSITISNAYFFPGRRFRRALCDAALRGVRVRLLLQGRVEYPLQYYASQALYGNLLASGVEIYEYRASFLHAKVAVVDGTWATVGSSNIDPFSLLLAREANVFVRDKSFAARLQHKLDQAIHTQAQPVEANAAQPWHQRLLNRCALGLMRLAVLLAAQRGDY